MYCWLAYVSSISWCILYQLWDPHVENPSVRCICTWHLSIIRSIHFIFFVSSLDISQVIFLHSVCLLGVWIHYVPNFEFVLWRLLGSYEVRCFIWLLLRFHASWLQILNRISKIMLFLRNLSHLCYLANWAVYWEEM